MRRLLTLFCLFVALWWPHVTRALDPHRGVDGYAVRGWTMSDGLPHNLVQSLAQDGSGMLWVATWEGLAIFNGREFSPLPVPLPEELDTHGAGALLSGVDGGMLVGTIHAGVLRFADGRWERLGGESGSRLSVTMLAHGHGGDLWIGTRDSLYRLDAGGRLEEVGAAPELGGGITFVVLAERTGGVLLGSSRGLFRWTAGGRIEALGSRIGLPPGRSARGLVEIEGGLWIAGDDGAWLWQGDTLEKVVRGPTESVLIDREGQVWVSMSAGGLVRRSPDGGLQRLGARHGLAGRSSRALFEDREGLLWTGTTEGLYRIVDGPVSGIGPATGLGDGYVRSILQTGDADIWIGHGGGLDRWHEGELYPIALMGEGRTISPVMALADSRDGGIWAGTFINGLIHVLPDPTDPQRYRVTRVEGMPAGQVRALQQQPDGALWVGGTFGLMRLHDGAWETIEEGLPSRFVQSLMLEEDGTLWIGTNKGMARRTPDGAFKTWSSGQAFPAHTAFDFLRGSDGGLWIASDRGLLRLRDGRFSRYGIREGLPREVLFRVLDDGRGSLWLSSNDGLFRVELAELDNLVHGNGQRLPVEVFGREDGMPDSQANGGSHPAGWRTADGRLWFPTARGVAIVDPAAAEDQRREQIAVVVQSVQTDGIERGTGPEFTLASGGKRIRIRYAGMSLRSAEKLRYRYRMEGVDKGWVEAGHVMEAIYTHLPPGRLRFEVQATRLPVEWDDGDPARVSGTGLVFDSPLPWWRLPHWMTLLMVVGLLLLWAIYRLGALQQRRSRLYLRRRIEAATRELREQRDALVEATRERESLLAKLEYQARHDALTGLPNRRAGDECLDRALERARAEDGPLAVALFDLDHFKRVNDVFGHGVGDDVLRSVGTMAVGSLGPDVFVGRHGGEEFLVCMPGVAQGEARERLEALCRRVASSSFAYGSRELQCTLSAGLAEWRKGDTAQTLLARADAALYRAKDGGRNRVMVG